MIIFQDWANFLGCNIVLGKKIYRGSSHRISIVSTAFSNSLYPGLYHIPPNALVSMECKTGMQSCLANWEEGLSKEEGADEQRNMALLHKHHVQEGNAQPRPQPHQPALTSRTASATSHAS